MIMYKFKSYTHSYTHAQHPLSYKELINLEGLDV